VAKRIKAWSRHFDEREPETGEGLTQEDFSGMGRGKVCHPFFLPAVIDQHEIPSVTGSQVEPMRH
jgi:hypothetical protein